MSKNIVTETEELYIFDLSMRKHHFTMLCKMHLPSHSIPVLLECNAQLIDIATTVIASVAAVAAAAE